MIDMNWKRGAAFVALCGLAAGVAAPRLTAATRAGKQDAAAPVVLSLPTRAPKGATVLFSGKAAELQNNFYKRYSKDPATWTVGSDGAASPAKSDITSKQEFGDCFLHAEFKCPETGHGNSGIGFEGRYEVQVFSSFGEKPDIHNAGALYDQKPAVVMASKKGGEWQTYDIIFRTPRFDGDGKLTEKARATVFLNGVLVQNNEEFNGPTGIQYGEFKDEVKTGPVIFQGDHDPVQYRNIWVVAQ